MTDLQPAQPPPLRILKPKPLLLRLLSDHNPFYLLSAACMLASCLAITNSLSWRDITTTRLLALILTLNLYEAALLAIALFLVIRRRLQRDGRMLLLLQAFFLADFTFLNAETATRGVAFGVMINLLLLLLATIKLGAVVYFLKPGLARWQLGFVLLQVAVILLLPCLLKWIDGPRGIVGPRHLYGAWWLLFLLPVIYELLAWLNRDAARQCQPGWTGLVNSYFALPYLSLITHLGILHYVYDARFYGAHAAPVLLGLTLVLNRISPTTLVPRRDLLVLRLLLPAGALLVSLNNPFTIVTRSAYPAFALNPLNLVLAAAFLTYAYCFLWHLRRIVLPAGAAAAAFYIIGPTRDQLASWTSQTWNWSTTTAAKIVPKTLSEWGVVGLVASFVLLGIGFWVSLGKSPGQAQDPPAQD